MLIRRWAMVGDQPIHSRETVDASAADARPVVLVHGVASTSRYFRPLLRELDGRLPACAVELPGIGQSGSSRLPADIAGQADVVAAWLRATGRRPAALVGNSMGAQTVVELALRHPELAAPLVLIGPTVDPAARNALAQIGRLLLDAMFERPSLVAVLASDAFLIRTRAGLRYFAAALAHRMEDRLPLVDTPVLILRGVADPLAPRRWARQLAASAPNARLVEVPGGAHDCHHGRPGLVADLVTDFVSSVS